MPQTSNIRALFAIADYRRLWWIGAGVGTARWLETLALGIFVFRLTGSPALVALLAIVRMLPYVAFGFLVGALADFLDRKRLLLATFAVAAASAGAMAVLSSSGLAGYVTALIVSGAGGLVWVTDMPIRRRLLVDAAGPERVASALGFDNATNHATRAIGPLLGGAVYQFLGVEGIFALALTIYAVCACLAARLEIPRPAVSAAVRPSIRSLLVPPAELIGNRSFRVLLGVTAIYNLWCFPFVGMIPVIAQKDFLLAPAGVGALSACDGLGGTLGAVVVGIVATNRSLFRVFFSGTVALLAIMLALSAWLQLGPAIIAFVAIGICSACFSATQYAIVHNIVRPEIRGRATGFLSLFIGMSTLGHFHAGLMFDRFASSAAMRIMAVEGLLAAAALAVYWIKTGADGRQP